MVLDDMEREGKIGEGGMLLQSHAIIIRTAAIFFFLIGVVMGIFTILYIGTSTEYDLNWQYAVVSSVGSFFLLAFYGRVSVNFAIRFVYAWFLSMIIFNGIALFFTKETLDQRNSDLYQINLVSFCLFFVFNVVLLSAVVLAYSSWVPEARGAAHKDDYISLSLNTHRSRRKESTDVIRKNSDGRVLGKSDLRLSQMVKIHRESVASSSEADGAVDTRSRRSSSVVSYMPPIQASHGHGAAGAGGEELDLDKEDDEHDHAGDFKYSHGLTSAQAKVLLEKHGRNELPEKHIPLWYIFVQQLWQPMPGMIWMAIIIECSIQNFLDMGILLFIQFGNASIGFYEITKVGQTPNLPNYHN